MTGEASSPEIENIDALWERFDSVIHRLVHTHGAGDFGDFLIFAERHGVPHEVAKKSIWNNILTDNIGFMPDGQIESTSTPE